MAATYAGMYEVPLAEARRRLEDQQRGLVLNKDLRDRLGADYAGAWYDNQEGRFKIGYTHEGARARIEGILPDYPGFETALIEVQSSWDDLLAVKERVAKDMDAVMSKGGWMAGVDTSRTPSL